MGSTANTIYIHKTVRTIFFFKFKLNNRHKQTKKYNAIKRGKDESIISKPHKKSSENDDVISAKLLQKEKKLAWV